MTDVPVKPQQVTRLRETTLRPVDPTIRFASDTVQLGVVQPATPVVIEHRQPVGSVPRAPRVLEPLSPLDNPLVATEVERTAEPRAQAPYATSGGLVQGAEFEPVRRIAPAGTSPAENAPGPATEVDHFRLPTDVFQPEIFNEGPKVDVPLLHTESYVTGQRRLKGKVLNGQPHGIVRWWHPNGELAMEGPYDSGIPVGQWTCSYPNGQRAIVGRYERGMPTGRWSSWNEDGQILQTEIVAPPRPLRQPPHETY